jgi:SP family myo-inositol transporter-like MFS transporter 13
VTILCLFITGGQVVAYIVGWLFSTTTSGWRWIVGLGTLPAVLQFAIVVVLPETPRWLVQAGLEAEALHVLSRVYQGQSDNHQIAKQVVRSIQLEVAEEEEEMDRIKPSVDGTRIPWLGKVAQRAQDLFRVGGNRRALIIATMLQGLQQHVFLGDNFLNARILLAHPHVSICGCDQFSLYAVGVCADR